MIPEVFKYISQACGYGQDQEPKFKKQTFNMMPMFFC